MENSDDSPSEEAANQSPVSENEQAVAEDEAMADEEEEEDDGKGPPKLFTMNFVNSYGNAHLEQLNNDDKPLKLTSKLNLMSFRHLLKLKIIFYHYCSPSLKKHA